MNKNKKTTADLKQLIEDDKPRQIRRAMEKGARIKPDDWQKIIDDQKAKVLGAVLQHQPLPQNQKENILPQAVTQAQKNWFRDSCLEKLVKHCNFEPDLFLTIFHNLAEDPHPYNCVAKVVAEIADNYTPSENGRSDVVKTVLDKADDPFHGFINKSSVNITNVLDPELNNIDTLSLSDKQYRTVMELTRDSPHIFASTLKAVVQAGAVPGQTDIKNDVSRLLLEHTRINDDELAAFRI